MESSKVLEIFFYPILLIFFNLLFLLLLSFKIQMLVQNRYIRLDEISGFISSSLVIWAHFLPI